MVRNDTDRLAMVNVLRLVSSTCNSAVLAVAQYSIIYTFGSRLFS